MTPGLGQVYNGQMLKGIIFFLATFLLIILLSFTGLQFDFYGLMVIILISLVFWLCIVLEAFFAAVKIKEIQLKVYNRWFVYLLLVFLSVGIDFVSSDFLMTDVLHIKGYKISTESMHPTLQKGESIMINIKHHRARTLQRGDLVIYKFPGDSSEDFVGRVVGLEGEKVEIINKRVLINDRLLQEDYRIHTDSRIHFKKIFPYDDERRDNYGPVMIPWGTCFVLGDNRDNSHDSRYWGFLSLKRITGKVAYIYLSSDLMRLGRNLRQPQDIKNHDRQRPRP